MIITFLTLVTTLFIQEKVRALESILEGPFDSDLSDFEDELPFQRYIRYSLIAEGNEIKVMELHVIILHGIEGRTAIRNAERLWENGIVPYKISKTFDEEQRSQIQESIQEFHRKTCIRFIPHNEQSKFLFIGSGKGCRSMIGKNPELEKTEMQLTERCFLVPGILLHEMMHILGFVHEHNRPDRDNYVKIIEENIMKGKLSQFKKYTWKKVQSFNFGYDYGSIMHYGHNFFSKSRNLSTIVPLKKGVTIGQRTGFSETDILKLKALYKCQVTGEPSDNEEEYKWAEEDISDL